MRRKPLLKRRSSFIHKFPIFRVSEIYGVFGSSRFLFGLLNRLFLAWRDVVGRLALDGFGQCWEGEGPPARTRSIGCGSPTRFRRVIFPPLPCWGAFPLKDPEPKAGFIGLALRPGPGHFVRALLEGVAFALRQIVDTMVGCGADLTRLVGAAMDWQTPIWRQIVRHLESTPMPGTGKQASERAGVGRRWSP